MPENVTLLSGPGCPVCVTANDDIDTAIEFARQPDVIVTTFGDMMKVPGSLLARSRARRPTARDVRIVYSPLDALAIAEDEPGQAGRLHRRRLRDHRPDHRRGDPARASDAGLDELQRLLGAQDGTRGAARARQRPRGRRSTRFILPGHVSTIIGLEPYEFLAEEYGVPSVITGFEPVDVLQGVWMLVKQLAGGSRRDRDRLHARRRARGQRRTHAR